MAHDTHASAPGADVDTRVKLLLQQGKTIAAIQLVREATGWDLQKAKDYVEGLQALE